MSVKNQCITLSEASLFKAEFGIHRALIQLRDRLAQNKK